MIKEIPYIEFLPSDWNVIPNRFLFYYDGKKVGDEHAQYQLLSLTTAGVKKRDINATGGKVPTSYDNYQTVKKGQMVFCLFDLDCSAVFSGISEYDGMITSAYDVFSTSDKMDTRYADYWFKYVFSNRYYKMYSKNIRYTITGDMFRALKTPVPPLEVQKQISSLLRNQEQKIDNLIANVQAQIEKLKAYKQSLITEVVTKGLDPNAPMKDSGVEWMGKIPEHWSILRFKNIADIKSNLVNPKDYMDYFQLSPENIEKGSGKLLTCLTVREIGVESNNHLFHKGQIIYSKVRPLLNKVAIAPFDGLCSADMYPVETKINKKFLVYSMLSDSFLNQVKLVTENRVKMPKINQEELSKIKVCCPDDSEQKEIADYLDTKCAQIDLLISLKESKIEKLQQYKRSLIYEYVTGKKEVV